jgi:hypothetical protein
MAQAQALQEAHKAEPSSEPMGLDSDFEPMEALPAFPEVPPVMAEGGAARNGAPAREEPPVPDLAPLIASSSGYASDVRCCHSLLILQPCMEKTISIQLAALLSITCRTLIFYSQADM